VSWSSPEGPRHLLVDCAPHAGPGFGWSTSANNLLQMKVFPVLPKGDQKVALSYTSVATKESSLVEYIYPLKTDGKATATLEESASPRHQEPARASPTSTAPPTPSP